MWEIDSGALDRIFRTARTARRFLQHPVELRRLRDMYDLAKLAPTSFNCSPLRVVFVTTPEAKERLRPTLDPANVDKTLGAPVTAILAYDSRFYLHLSRLFPQSDVSTRFEQNPEYAQVTAFRNGTLQSAYFILAARALGFDVGPMSGFDHARVDAEFFPEGRYRSNFLCNIGRGDTASLRPRNPRLDFDEACTFV